MRPSYALAFTLLVACDAQVTTSYRGEPLTTIHGRLVTGAAPAPRSLEVVLFWHKDGRVLPSVLSTVELGKGAETSFAAELHRAPPEAFIHRCSGGEGGGRLGFAWIAALAPGTVREEPLWLSDFAALEQSGALNGSAADRVLVWVEEEALPDSSGSRALGGTLPAGAHLMAPAGGRLWLVGQESEVLVSLDGGRARWPSVPAEACAPVLPVSAATESLIVGSGQPMDWGQMR